MPSILVNGHSLSQVSILDRGFQFGDGLFETIRISSGLPQYWQQHINRLFSGCDRLGIPGPDKNLLQSEAMALCENIEEGVLKIIVTRGSGGRGYTLPAEINATRVLACFPLPDYPAEYWNDGVALKICETRLGMNPSLAGIKHLNRLEQILARAELNDANYQEGLMLDTENNVIEGTMTNLFCVRDGELLTPDLSRCGVKGIIRDQVIKAAKEMGIDMHETTITLQALYNSDEIFICNSVIHIWPVRQLDAHEFMIGPITQRVTQQLNRQGHGRKNVA